jgi:signal peptidase I
VVGDNRDRSADSRFNLGGPVAGVFQPAFVPHGHIKGKAMVIWFSFSYQGLLSNVFGGTGIRTDRFFTPVD